MIRVELPSSEYTDEIVHKNGMYYKYICPVFLEETTLAYELSFSKSPTAKEIKAAKQAEIPFSKSVLIDSIDSFDSSSAVNEFFINGVGVWVDRTVRASQMTAILSAEILEHDSITLAFGGVSYTMSIAEAKNMLATIESYALDVNNITISHKESVEAFTTLEEVLTYDYTTGYPEKPSFNLQEVSE